MIKPKQKTGATFYILIILAALFLVPIILVLINSFKSRLYISSEPFSLPNAETFVGLQNYVNGLKSSGILMAFFRSVFITVFSVLAIVLCTSMTAWFIVRMKNLFTKVLYYLFVFSK